ncbi:MAG: hypothetical protein DMG65_01690 [Candidatus Angelobacter sp. Gp1-AA117]|nr:MAG: hypothetical protein DMG65_01690 [Candidatus Angelobacter sp. Gp1-AA117]
MKTKYKKADPPQVSLLTHRLIFGRKLGANSADLAGFVPPSRLFKSFTDNNLVFSSFHGMEEVVGSIPTRSTIFSITYRHPGFPLGVRWCQTL